MSDEIIINNIWITEETIKTPLQPQPNQAKLIKRTAAVLKVVNDFFIHRFNPSNESIEKWNSEDNQYKLRLLINEKKFKCQKEPDDEETILRKALRKEHKKEEKVIKKAEKQINKLKGRPKSACYYYIQDERPNVLLEHPEWNSKDHKREIYLELQNRWKIARLTDKLAHYTKIAEDTYKNMPIPVKKPFIPYDRDARKKNSIGTVAPDGKLITKYNKNKYKTDDEVPTPRFIKFEQNKPKVLDNRKRETHSKSDSDISRNSSTSSLNNLSNNRFADYRTKA